MHRNSRYFDKNDGKHNFYGEVDDGFEERDVSHGQDDNNHRHSKPEEDEKDNP